GARLHANESRPQQRTPGEASRRVRRGPTARQRSNSREHRARRRSGDRRQSRVARSDRACSPAALHRRPRGEAPSFSANGRSGGVARSRCAKVVRSWIMRFIAIRMLTAERSKYLGLIFAIAFCTFLLQNQSSIFAGILKRTGSQIADVTDASVWVMDPKTEYFEQTKALKDTDLLRVRGVPGVDWAVRLFKGSPIAKTESGKYAVTFMIGI